MRCEGAITKSERFFVWEQGVPQSIHLTERTAAQQMSIAMVSHPFGAGQVTIESMSCAIRFTIRVNVQHDPGNLSPVGSGRVGVEQTKVRDNVLLIVHRQLRVGRRRIVDIWIERRFLHWHPTQQRMGLATACTAGGGWRAHRPLTYRKL